MENDITFRDVTVEGYGDSSVEEQGIGNKARMLNRWLHPALRSHHACFQAGLVDDLWVRAG